MSEGITWVGIDAHKKFLNVAVLRQRGELVESKVENEPRAVRRLAKKLVREAQGAEVRCCYEAGPCGYALKRQLEQSALVVCEVVAPSLIPIKPGERVKTDRRDARKLAELFSANLLTEVRPPTEDEEAVRDVCRAREDVREDLTRARHRLSKFLLRRAIVFSGRAWTEAHRRWLRQLSFERDADRGVFDDYLLAIDQLDARLDAWNDKLEALAQREPYRAPVGALRCFRGIDTVTAMTLVCELHDFRRFTSPRALMSYVGLVPSEHSSGGHAKRGSITKTGNGHVRRVLIEAAWHYRHRPAVGKRLKKRREGQATAVIAIADRAQQRLCSRFWRMSMQGKQSNKVVTALARELVGFVWAAMNEQAALETPRDTMANDRRPPARGSRANAAA